MHKDTYLTLCTFSFEINESSLSDAKFMIQDVVSPHCGDKRIVRHCTRFSVPNYFVMIVIALKYVGKTHQCKQCEHLFNVYSLILFITNSWSYYHFQGLITIFPANVRSTFLK